LALAILLSPLLFYAYQLIPNVKIWETDMFVFNSHYFENVQVFFWTFLSKLTPLLLLMIWFTTCKHWWYHSIIVPISMMIFQIIGLFNDDIFHKDEVEKPYITIIIIAIAFLLYLIRGILTSQIILIDIREQIKEEINSLG